MWGRLASDLGRFSYERDIVLMLRLIREFCRSDEGLETAEWAVMAALFAVLASVAMGDIGAKVAAQFVLMEAGIP